jgi:catechol 2,3-dioxygenase-like lactoylglutathione lyase family enzyme
MVRIRYLAILSENPVRLADFYRRFLHMDELGRSEHGDITLSDGFYNFSIFLKRPALQELGMETGLHHLGVEVDNIEEVKARYLRFNPSGVIVDEPGGLQRGKVRLFDPECHPVTLSSTGFGIKEEKRFPRISHVALNALDTERIFSFYSEVFGFRELEASLLRRKQGKRNRFAGDGRTNLAIHPFYDDNEGHEARFGINHVGFLVQDLQASVRELSEAVAVESRPAGRPFAEQRLRDPEGNALDLSQTKGWQVDIDRWEKAA